MPSVLTSVEEIQVLSNIKKISSYRATASVPAGITVTFTDIPFTVNASKTLLAGTGVTSLASVLAGGSIFAGLMMGAVVQICKGKQEKKNF